jgi:hypothetical protein
MKLWLYGMRLRGFAPGCQPMMGLHECKDSEDRRYYAVLAYTRRLEERELTGYELDYLGTEGGDDDENQP